MYNPKKRIIIVLGLLLLFSLVLAACAEEEPVEVTRVVEVPGADVEVTREVEVPGPEVEVTRVVEVMVEPEGPAITIPFEEQWASSAHADAEAEAFVHWDEDDPAEVSASCAKCHSTPGFQDFVGADGSEAGVVDGPAPIGTTVECEACHNDATLTLTSVTMPSGIVLEELGTEARCMTCHQGRNSTVQVNEGIAEAGLGEGDEDTVSEDVGFDNIHYYAAAATQYGTAAMGGYEYDGKAYDAKFDHVAPYNTCVACHNPHTLEVRFEECTQCHTGLESSEDLVNIRMPGSLVDYNGNGDMEEGIMAEIEGLQAMLYQAMQAYAAEVAGTGVVYDSHTYPYFFLDTDGDGEVGEEEANYGNQFNIWTPRLAKAAYNYQVSKKDPGEFAHGGKYIIQLLYDSIESLNEAVSAPVDLSMANRIDHGHFAGSEEAFRHWDEDGAVPGSCSRCHSAEGLPLFIEQGVTINQPTANGLNCATCHDDLSTYTRYQTEDVTFPSGSTVTLDDPDANLCMNCHQGRSSGPSVDSSIGDLPDDEVSDALGFINVHYFAAGASLFGSEAQGAYQYAGNEYVGRNEHVSSFDVCIECHDTHALEVKYEDCGNCHDGVESEADLHNIRVSDVDYDGDGDVSEGMADEIGTMSEVLLAAIQAYAVATEGVEAIVYDSHAYPYFFIDTDGSGEADGGEANYGNSFATWTPNLLRAAYNYQYAQKDPGGFAHNGQYILQALYDSIEAMGGDTAGLTRP
jgi:hypothetical protein